MNKNAKTIIFEKSSVVYKLCVCKYFELIKTSDVQADFFKFLAIYCKRLVQNRNDIKVNQTLCPKSKISDINRAKQNFFNDSNKVLWRKNFINTAYLLGYGKSTSNDITKDKSQYHQRENVLSTERLWSFLHETEQIIKKEKEFKTIKNKLKQLCQHYKLSFMDDKSDTEHEQQDISNS